MTYHRGCTDLESRTEIEKTVVMFFMDRTWELFECCYDDLEDGGSSCPYVEVYDRIQSYISYSPACDCKSVREFLEQDGYDSEGITFFFEKYNAAKDTVTDQGVPRGTAFEVILSYFLKDTLDLMTQVLQNDPLDPHHSAITTIHSLEWYSVFQPVDRQKSPRELLYDCGQSEDAVDKLYEGFRKEIVRWHGSHPLPPSQIFGELAVYHVENRFVAALPENSMASRDSAGVEFDQERRCIWTQNMSLTDEGELTSWVEHGAAPEDLAPPFYQIRFGRRMSAALYVMPNAYLCSVIFQDGKFARLEKFDLLT